MHGNVYGNSIWRLAAFALTAFRRYYLLKNKLSDGMIKQLLNSVIAKYRHLSVSQPLASANNN